MIHMTTFKRNWKASLFVFSLTILISKYEKKFQGLDRISEDIQMDDTEFLSSEDGSDFDAFDDDLIEIDSDNDREFKAEDAVEDWDDASDEEWTERKKNCKKKSKKKQKYNDTDVVELQEESGQKRIIKRIEPPLSIAEIQAKINENECDIEVDPRNNLIKRMKPITE